jgi:hypothetical protein
MLFAAHDLFVRAHKCRDGFGLHHSPLEKCQF